MSASAVRMLLIGIIVVALSAVDMSVSANNDEATKSSITLTQPTSKNGEGADREEAVANKLSKSASSDSQSSSIVVLGSGSEKADTDGSAADGQNDAGSEPTNTDDKRFMKGVDHYIAAFKSNMGEREQNDLRQSQFETKTDSENNGDDEEVFSFKVDEDQDINSDAVREIMEDGKRFMRGFEAYLSKNNGAAPGKRDDDTDVDKRFMRGFEQYMPGHGKRNNRFETDAADGDSVADKRFMRGFEGYLRNSGKRNDGYNSEDESVADKRFMRGFEGYMRNSGKRDNGYGTDFDNDTAPDKRFMRGFEQYMQGKRNTEDIDGDSEADKRFMKGFEQYLHNSPRVKQNDELNEEDTSSNSNDKRFMRGFEGYMSRRPGKRGEGHTNDENGDVNEDKRFMRGFDAYMKGTGKRDDATGDIADHKRFMKGFEHYMPKRDQANNENERELTENKKRFIKGVDWYIQRHPNTRLPSQRVKRSEDGELSDLKDNKFRKGIDPYLQMYASHLPSKRFLKGINPYLLAYAGSYPQKRFLKGINPYLQIYASTYPSKRFMRIPSMQLGDTSWKGQFGKRSESFDSEEGANNSEIENDKRFMRGFQHYMKPSSKGRQRSKRFMKGINPYLQSYLSHLQNTRSDFSEMSLDKRFLKGINPYLQMYASQYQDKRYGGTLGDFSTDKRFMKGINPYLQMYANARPDIKSTFDLLDESPEKRFIKGPLLQMVSDWHQGKRPRGLRKGSSADKRFLKGINPYLQVYSSRLHEGRYGDDFESSIDKRFVKGMDEHLLKFVNLQQTDREDEDVTMDISDDKRFMKGVDHYIRQFGGHRRIRRDVKGDITAGKTDVNATESDVTTEKRFLKGINPYLQMYASRPQHDKKNAQKKPAKDKRFMKGINHYLQMYANNEYLKRDEQQPENPSHSSDQRFLKGIDSYLQMYSSRPQGKRDHAEDMPDKRFIKGINSYLQNFARYRDDKRFMRGFDPYLQNQRTGKRFMKGINAYLQRAGKRDPEVVAVQNEGKDGISSKAEAGDPMSKEAGQKPEKKFIKNVNHYLQMHGGAGRRRRQADFIDEDTIRLMSSGPSDMDLPPEKRFLKGLNDYLLHYASFQRPARSDIDDMETAIGDRLALQLADTANDMFYKGGQFSNFRYNQNEAGWPSEVPRITDQQLQAIDELSNLRKFSLNVDDDFDDERRWYNDNRLPQKREFFNYRRSWEPSYGARQFMTWYNGDYRLG